MSPKVKGFTAGSIAAASYGLNPLFALPLYREGIGVDSVLFYRYAFAIGMMAVLLRFQKVDMRVRRREWPLLALYGLLFSASSLFLFLSYNYMDAGIASTILFMYPVMVALIMAMFFHEKASLLTWLCIVLAVGGVSLLTKTSDGSTVSLLGITFVLLSSLSYAIYIVGVNRSSIARMPSAKLTFYALCFGILIYITRTRGLTELQVPHSVLGWTCAFCLALFPTIISLVTMTISIRNIGSTPAAILGALEPITALVVGTLVFGERLTPRICMGIVLVLLAVTLLVAGKKIYYTLRNSFPGRSQRTCLLFLCILVAQPSLALRTQECPLEKVEVEFLPSLHVPRFGHATFCIKGEVVVMGGHTSGFVPTPTAEFLNEGVWNVVPMVYSHDQGFAIQLKSDEVLIAGGHEQPLGIGQTFPVERYNPDTHTFEGFGCLEYKRCMADAVELADGRVLVAGNWYGKDAMEFYNGDSQFHFIRNVTVARSNPQLFLTGRNDAMLFAGQDEHNERFDSIVIDRLHGESFCVPLFREWKPMFSYNPLHRSSESFIGDEEKGVYAYLFPVQNSEGQVALAKTVGEDFFLLPTVCPVPMKTQWGEITYYASILADHRLGRAYLMGFGHDGRHYVLCADYGSVSEGQHVPLTLYYTDPLPDVGLNMPVLTPDGNLVLAGGIGSDNFHPSDKVVMFHLVSRSEPSVSRVLWIGIVLGAILLLVGVWFVFRVLLHRRGEQKEVLDIEDDIPILEQDAVGDEELMNRICQLMDEREPYLRNDLKLQDVAVLLNTSARAVSDTIRVLQGCSFNQYINSYRVGRAKQLLRTRPESKIATLYVEAGFSNEMSFFRAFKALTGFTPREWKQRTEEESSR